MLVGIAQVVLSATLAAAACIPAGMSNSVAMPPATQNPPPVSESVRLHPNGNTNWCLEVQGNKRADGTPVQLAQCSSSSAQAWIIKRGSTQVKLANTNFCLDAGSCEFSPTPALTSSPWERRQEQDLDVLSQPRCANVVVHGRQPRRSRGQATVCRSPARGNVGGKRRPDLAVLERQHQPGVDDVPGPCRAPRR